MAAGAVHVLRGARLLTYHLLLLLRSVPLKELLLPPGFGLLGSHPQPLFNAPAETLTQMWQLRLEQRGYFNACNWGGGGMDRRGKTPGLPSL